MRREVANFRLILIVPTTEQTIDVSTTGVDGGFFLSIFQRDDGYETLAFEIEGRPEDGRLLVEIRDKRGTAVASSLMSR